MMNADKSLSGRFVNLLNHYVWCVVGLVVVSFAFVSLREHAFIGQMCLIVSLVCMAFAQVERLDTTTYRWETTLGSVASALAVFGLVLIWPAEAKLIVVRFLEGLAAIRG